MNHVPAKIPGKSQSSPCRNTVCDRNILLAAQFLAFLTMLLSSGIDSTAQTTSTYAKDFRDAAVSSETLLIPAGSAALSNYAFKPAGFGSGGDGMKYHYGVSLADNVNGKFMRKFAFAALSGHEEHYQPLGSGHGFWKRIEHAARHSVFVSPESSSRLFNWSGLPASLASAALSNAYQPLQQRSWSATLVRFSTNSATYVGGDMWLELTEKAQKHLLFRSFLKSH